MVHDLHEPNQKQNRQTNTNQISETFQEPHNQITESFSITETFSNNFRERLYCYLISYVLDLHANFYLILSGSRFARAV